ncbi:MAG: DF family (seleno)protein [Gaiellaceae bacterium]
MSTPVVEVLTFEGCPHAEPALELVRRVVAETGVTATIRQIDVPDTETAEAHRFLGSPTIQVNGHDIEPGAEERADYVLSCRIYCADDGFRGEPDERWLRDALRAHT